LFGAQPSFTTPPIIVENVSWRSQQALRPICPYQRYRVAPLYGTRLISSVDIKLFVEKARHAANATLR
jgi:hypothetical protein